MSEHTYNIRFVAIELISKSILEPPQNIESKETFTFNYSVDIKVAPEQKTATVTAIVGIVLVKENREVANFKIFCVFELPDFDELVKKIGENKYDVPVDLEIILKSTGISTIRGIIALEVKGTYLQGAVLPLVDMNALVRNQRKELQEKSK